MLKSEYVLIQSRSRRPINIITRCDGNAGSNRSSAHRSRHDRPEPPSLVQGDRSGTTDNLHVNYDDDLLPALGLMGDFNGVGPGDWTLSVDDTLGADTGTLDCWALNLLCQ